MPCMEALPANIVSENDLMVSTFRSEQPESVPLPVGFPMLPTVGSTCMVLMMTGRSIANIFAGEAAQFFMVRILGVSSRGFLGVKSSACLMRACTAKKYSRGSIPSIPFCNFAD